MFVRDRSRAVRTDFTMQHETGALAIECHDRCARFHIMALHLERDNSNFSIALEEQQLMNSELGRNVLLTIPTNVCFSSSEFEGIL